MVKYVKASKIVSYDVNDNNTLEIWYGNTIISEVSDVSKDLSDDALANMVDDVLSGLGYIWNADGTLTNAKSGTVKASKNNFNKYVKAGKEDYIEEYGLDTIMVEDDYIQLWANQGQTEAVLNKTGKTIYVTVYDSGNGHSYWGNKDYFGNPVDSARHSPFTFTLEPHGQRIIEGGPNRIQDIQIHQALKDGTYEVSFDGGSAYNDWDW